MSDTLATATYIDFSQAGTLAQVTIRADLTNPDVRTSIQSVAGLTVPDALCVTHEGGKRLVWMSPDELLLVLPDDVAVAEVASLQEALADRHAMALDVSDTRALFRLNGQAVGEVLAKGAPCDLSDAGFPPGMARRTHLAGLAVGVWRLSPDAWEVVCFRSFAHHLDLWLETAARDGAQVY